MRFFHLYKIFFLFLVTAAVTSCSSYKELTVNDKIILPEESQLYRFSETPAEQKTGLKSGRQKKIQVTSKKYLARGKDFTPESEIMNKGVEEALKGNYPEAETLFEAIRENNTDGAVENNLAVVYELTKRKKDAMKMYTIALIKSPENSEFRSNLLSFISYNKFGNENQMNLKTGKINAER